MFKWLKDKVNKKMNNEMHNCITQNLNFVYMVEARKYALKDNINEEVMSHIYMIKDQSENIQNSKTEGDDFTNDESDILLKLNMDCRKLWANYFGGSESNYDYVKNFKIKNASIMQKNNFFQSKSQPSPEGFIIAGDHCFYGSIEGAVLSGIKASEKVLS